jgi:glycosyltransferase involved in cell wall biosynthesis
MRKLRINRPIIWVICPAACDIALRMEKLKLVYLRTDRYEEYPNVDRGMICKYDQRLKTKADITVFVSQHLFEQERNSCKKAIYLDHGVDFEMFATAEDDKDVPEDVANIESPIVGFFGGIDDHTFDVEFVKKVVDLLPQMSFVFVGNVSVNCDGLLSKKNVWMLGQKPYEQIPHYGKCFDVAIMPWKQNRWIEACNPIKLKEYLALGKPTVSTPFAELHRYRDVVYQAKTPAEFANCIREAIKHNDLKLVARRRKKVKSSSWGSRAEQVLQTLFVSRPQSSEL